MKHDKIDSFHMVPKNKTQVITYEHTGHQSYIKQVYSPVANETTHLRNIYKLNHLIQTESTHKIVCKLKTLSQHT